MINLREEIKSEFEKGKANTWVVVNVVVQTIAYNLAKSRSVIAECMQNAVGGDFGWNFHSMDIMFDKLLITPLWTEANTCV